MPDEKPPTETSKVTTSDTEEHVDRYTNIRRELFPINEPMLSGESAFVNSNKFQLLKLPNFWIKQPKLWFVQLESEFLFYRIRSDGVKYNSVIRHLDQQVFVTVADIVKNPSVSEKYICLKEALISRFSDSEEKRIHQLLASLELNDKKPSDLLREVRQLASGAIADNVLLTIWLQRLPQCVHATLAVVED